MKFDYPALASQALERITRTQGAALESTVTVLTRALAEGGVIQVFGTGHARIPAHEMAGRAGGLIPVNLIRLQDLVFRGGAAPTDFLDPTLERDPMYGARLFDLVSMDTRDVLIVFSNSGINGAVVEFVRLVKETGIPIVAVCSFQHSAAVASRHPSGAKLVDQADIAIDTGAPVGDAALEIDERTSVGALSNLVGVYIAQLLTEGVAKALRAKGLDVPVYRSMNVPGGDEANADYLEQVRGRVFPIEP